MRRKTIAFACLATACLHSGHSWSQTMDTKRPLDVFVDVDKAFLEKPVHFSWGKDPFQRKPGYFYSEPKEEKMHLSAIVNTEGGRSVAIINNMSAFVNSKINGFVVKQIGSNYVVLQKDNTTRELVLAPVEQEGDYEITIWDRLPAAAPDDEGDSED
jgi:hypothetical protein